MWRNCYFLHTAIMPCIPNTPGCTLGQSSSSTHWLSFFYHPQVGVGVWVELLIFICTSESLLTCSCHVASPGKKSNQRSTCRMSCSRVSFSTNWLKYRTGSNEERAIWSLIYSTEHQPKSQNADKRIWLTGFASRLFVFFPHPANDLHWMEKCITPTEPNVLS